MSLEVLFHDLSMGEHLPQTMVFDHDMRLHEHMVDDGKEFFRRVPRYDLKEFRAWCTERRLRLTGQPGDTGCVYFDTEDERFEFKVRWGV